MTDARRVLLERLVDDAGLFPPASLDLDEAMAAHRRHRRGPWAWMLGRFLCPASRLDSLAAAPERLIVGVILDGAGRAPADRFEAALEADVDAVATVAASSDRVQIGAVEVRLPEATADCAGEVVAALAGALPDPGTIGVYLEAPTSTDIGSLGATVAAVAHVRAATGTLTGAKVRCGGTSAGSVPGPAALAAFLAAALAAGVPFKATAGLHHPTPTVDPATGDTVHGFLHLAAATALLATGAITTLGAAELLADREPGAVGLDARGLTWREHAAGADVLRRCRRVAYHGHGSCSFDEPIADLVALGVLGPSGPLSGR